MMNRVCSLLIVVSSLGMIAALSHGHDDVAQVLGVGIVTLALLPSVVSPT